MILPDCHKVVSCVSKERGLIKMTTANKSFKLEISMSVEELADAVTGKEIRIMKMVESDFNNATANFTSTQIASSFVKSVCFDLVIGDRESLNEGGQEFVSTLDRIAKGEYPPQFHMTREDETYLSTQCQKILNWMEYHYMIQVA